MSRLTEIIDNHHNLDQLFSIVKHYGVNAEYLSAALLRQLDEDAQNEGEENEEKEDAAYSQELTDDLKQFCARF